MTTKQTKILGILFLVFTLSLSIASGQQDYTRWGLPDGAIARLRKGTVNEIAYSPDGKLLAVATFAGIWLYDAETTEELALMEGTTEVNTIAFSPDGNTLASGTNGYSTTLWDVGTRTAKSTLKGTGMTYSVSSIVYSTDGKRLATGEFDRIRIWDAETGELIITLTEYEDSENIHFSKLVRVNTLAFSPDGSIIASGCTDKNIRLWDVNTGKIKTTLTGHKGQITSVTFHPDGGMLASGSWDSTVRLWDVETGTLKATLKGHTGGSRSVTFSPDRNTIGSCGTLDATIQFWDIRQISELQNKPIHTFVGHTSPIMSIAYSPNGRHLVSASNDGTIRFWDIASGEHINTIRGHLFSLDYLTFSPDGSTLVCTSDTTLRLWNVNTATYINSLVGHTNRVSSAAFSPDGEMLVSGSFDNSIQLWDVNTAQSINILLGHTDRVTSVALSPNGKLLASGSHDKTIRLWEIDTGKLKTTLVGHTDPVLTVLFNPDGRILASGSKDKTIRLWHIPSGTHLTTLNKHTDDVSSLTFSHDGKTLASGGRDKTIQLWDVATLTHKFTITGKDGFNAISISPDGKILVSAHYSKIGLWDVAKRAQIKTLRHHNQGVHSVSFSPKGDIFASGGLDGVVYLWDLSFFVKSKE